MAGKLDGDKSDTAGLKGKKETLGFIWLYFSTSVRNDTSPWVLELLQPSPRTDKVSHLP